MPILTVIVKDVDTSLGVSGANVCLFEGGGGIESPEYAAYSGTTDFDGTVTFDVDGFFRVGVAAEGYEQLEGDPCKPPPEWEDTWSCWGAISVRRDIEYLFEVRRVEKPPKFPTLRLMFPRFFELIDRFKGIPRTMPMEVNK